MRLLPPHLPPRLLLFALFASGARAEPVRVQIEQCNADLDALSAHESMAGDSLNALEQERKLLDEWLQRVGKLDFNALPVEDRVDAVLLRNHLEMAQMEREERAQERRELAPWLPFRESVDALADARVRGEGVVPEKAAAVLALLAKEIEQTRHALVPADSGPGSKAQPKASPKDAAVQKPLAKPTPEQAQRAAQAVAELAQSLSLWFKDYEGFLPEFGWWAKQPYDLAAKELDGYAKELREDLAGLKGGEKDPLLGRAIGAEALQRDLDHEFIPYTPQELIAVAEREFAWCKRG